MNILIFLVLMFGGESESKSLNVREAEINIRINQAKLQSINIEVKQSKVNRDHLKFTFERRKVLYKQEAISEQAYMEIKLQYELSVLQVEQEHANALEAEANLDLAKIKLEREIFEENHPQ